MPEVIHLRYPEPYVAVVEMRDVASRNTFSPDFCRGLEEVFARIADEARARAVVVHGYGNHFCGGGTREMLDRMASGKGRFTEASFYQLLLQCEVPTIAAMQGHAIGGGLTLGCYADLMVLAQEAIYSANFMQFGFTPGAGSTLLVPLKFGRALGHEMLYRANARRGTDLRARGATLPIVPGAEVIETAMRIARDLAEKPLTALKELKRELTRELRAQLPEVIERELRMHERCFADPSVAARIAEHYGA